MPLTPLHIAFMTARGLVVDPGTSAAVFAGPHDYCHRLPSSIQRRPHDPSLFGESFEVPCCGWQPFHTMSPAENVGWDGLPCNQPGQRPGCCQCSCEWYQQWWWIVGGFGGLRSDALLIEDAAWVRIEIPVPCSIAPPCTYPCEMLDPDTGVEVFNPTYCGYSVTIFPGGPSDYDCDGDASTDQDIEAFFRCLAGNCCSYCTPDYDWDGSPGTDADIQAFFAAL